MTKSEVSVAVIGAGNWGTSLIAALDSVGLPPHEVIGRRGWRRAKLEARVLWICVPDGAIAEVTRTIVERRGDLRGQTVLHSSGALSASILEPARRAGARVASVHPVMSFPTRAVVPLKGTMFGVEARGAALRRELFALVRRIGGAPFAVAPDLKALYHAAGVMASPLLVSALAAAMETAQLAGLDEKTATAWVRALAEATAGNVFERGARHSFSGPFARGDTGTIRLHLQALAAHPVLADVYCSLARHAIASLPVKNRRALAAEIDRAAGRDAAATHNLK